MTTLLRLEAPAKLNLSLTVVDRRDDGYHLLDGTMVLLEVADRLLLLPGCSGLRVEGEGSEQIPLDTTNLAWRGLVAGLGAEPELVCLTLDKRVPSAAGMGGGSSDAGAAWRLARRWRGLSEAPAAGELAELAAIGADVPFFAAQQAAARVMGIGERITPLPPSPSHVVLVHPPFGLSTAAVFAELRADEWGRAVNDLLAPALRLRPELADVMRAVADAGGEPRITGSGPTIFAMCDDPERADALVASMSARDLRTTRTHTRLAAASIESISEED